MELNRTGKLQQGRLTWRLQATARLHPAFQIQHLGRAVPERERSAVATSRFCGNVGENQRTCAPLLTSRFFRDGPVDEKTNSDPLALVRENQACAPSYDLDTDDIIIQLGLWQTLCSFRVVGADEGYLTLEFETLPADLDAFVKQVYAFCPDAIDEGNAPTVITLVKGLKENGRPIRRDWQEPVEGLNLEEPGCFLQVFKRQLERDKKLILWWEPWKGPKGWRPGDPMES